MTTAASQHANQPFAYFFSAADGRLSLRLNDCMFSSAPTVHFKQSAPILPMPCTVASNCTSLLSTAVHGSSLKKQLLKTIFPFPVLTAEAEIVEQNLDPEPAPAKEISRRLTYPLRLKIRLLNLMREKSDLIDFRLGYASSSDDYLNEISTTEWSPEEY